MPILTASGTSPATPRELVVRAPDALSSALLVDLHDAVELARNEKSRATRQKVRVSPERDGIRVSFGLFNSVEDVERLAKMIETRGAPRSSTTNSVEV